MKPETFETHPHVGIPFTNLSDWVLYDGYCAFRYNRHYSKEDVSSRFAFIEKTARIKTNYETNTWYEGMSCDEEYGKSERSLKWCDYTIWKFGDFNLDVVVNHQDDKLSFVVGGDDDNGISMSGYIDKTNGNYKSTIDKGLLFWDNKEKLKTYYEVYTMVLLHTLRNSFDEYLDNIRNDYPMTMNEYFEDAIEYEPCEF